MGYRIYLGSKKRTHRTLIALPAHYHRTQTRVIHKRAWRVCIRDKMALRAVSRGFYIKGVSRMSLVPKSSTR